MVHTSKIQTYDLKSAGVVNRFADNMFPLPIIWATAAVIQNTYTCFKKNR